MIEEFITAMRKHVPDSARIMFCAFRGDPNDDIPGKWKSRVLSRGAAQLDAASNIYFCVSAMQKNARGEFRRRKENFAGGLLLMIDDLGDGPGAKFPLALIDPLPPTCLIETSPQNFQAVYMFDRLVDDMDLFDALIRAFIDRQFLSADTGMAGVNRVFRPPIGVNGKAKYGGWSVQCAEWMPDRRYTVAEIAKAFDLTLVRRVRAQRDTAQVLAAAPDRIEAFVSVRESLRSAGMLKTDQEDYSGWIQMVCPWTAEHTAHADTGAAIRVPEVENEWYGAFRCHHGHCDGKGWRDLTQWLADEQAELLAMINRRG